eukprot:COSAG02_NODE_8469_length_2562_cov_1.366220_2_plen_89_part_00
MKTGNAIARACWLNFVIPLGLGTLLVLREKRLYTTSYDLGGVATAVVLRNCLAGVLHLTSVRLAAVLHLTSWSRNTRLADCGAACPLR